MRITEVLLDKKALAVAAERIAARYKANEYDRFEQEMLTLYPASIHANLSHLFDLYNPERQQEGAKAWARMIKQPEKYINSK